MTVKPTTHPTPEQLAAFGLGKLNETVMAAIADHLEACPDCSQLAAQVASDSFVGRARATRPTPSGTQFPGLPPTAPAPKMKPAVQLPPELVNHPKFRILDELGRGGMGVVYKAEHRLMEMTVALKVISQAVLTHPDALERFHREVRAAAKLDHPHIVRALDADRAGALHLLVMEFVEGINLHQAVQRKGPLPAPHACHYVRQAALGLQYAHEQGMVHRDVKPHNLMLTPRGQVKVLDFGLARLASEQKTGQNGLTRLGDFMGTPEYIAPEQAMDASRADIRADVYSLGCTLYFLLSGRPPFQEDTVVKQVLAHIEKEPVPLRQVRPEVAPELEVVVSRMLAKDPAQRFQKPIEVAEALTPFCKAGTKPQVPPPLPKLIAVAAPIAATVLPEGNGPLPIKHPGPGDNVTSPFAGVADPGHLPLTKKSGWKRLKSSGKRPGWIGVAIGGGLLLVGLAALWAAGSFKAKPRADTMVRGDLPADVEVFSDGEKVALEQAGERQGNEITLAPGTRESEIRKEDVNPETQEKVSRAIDKGLAYLRGQQAATGSWPGGHPLGYAALPGLTLLECGAAPDDPQVRKTATFVRQQAVSNPNTYEIGLAILFLDRLGDPGDEALLRTLGLRLLAGQTPAGGWGYSCRILPAVEEEKLLAALRQTQPSSPVELFLNSPDGKKPNWFRVKEPDANRPNPGVVPVSGPTGPLSREAHLRVLGALPATLRRIPALQVADRTFPNSDPGSDNSNTQFGALGLWVAGRHGVPIERALALLTQRFRLSRSVDGGWNYQHLPSGIHASSPTMTGAGLLVLAMGYGLIARDSSVSLPRRTTKDPAVEKALQVLVREIVLPAAGANPRAPSAMSRNLYFLWTLERVAMQYGLPTIEGKEWYRWGIDSLVQTQTANGSWTCNGFPGSTPLVDSSLALLFLKRANLTKDLTRTLESLNRVKGP